MLTADLASDSNRELVKAVLLQVEVLINFKQILILRLKQVHVSVLQYDYAFETEILYIYVHTEKLICFVCLIFLNQTDLR